jgi:hypothetical protein
MRIDQLKKFLMKNVRVILMTAAIMLAVSAAFATKISKRFFTTAYVAPAPTSCQVTTAPAVCNTVGTVICTVNTGGVPTTYYRDILETDNGYFCLNAFRKDP